jgi:enterochelin esterase family protein
MAGAIACSNAGAPINGNGGSDGSPSSSGNGTPDAGGSSDDAGVTPVGTSEAGGGTDAAAGTDSTAGAIDGAADGSGNGDGASNDGGITVTDPGTMGDGIVMIAQPFTPAPEMSDQAGVAKGKIIRFTMANSTTFGDGSRQVAIYVPSGYVSGVEIPFIVAQDGVIPQNGGSFGLDDLRPLLDNMIADGRLPAMAGVFVDPAGQRSVEYDTASDKYYQFVEKELLPQSIAQVMMQASLVLNLTKNPEGRATFGGSSGGAAAFTMGWFHPESYRRILTISGSFVNLQPMGCAAYATTLIPNAATPEPLRVFLEAGSNDLGGGSWRAANDAMGKALAAKGYHYRYVQAQGATHEDDGARREYLPSAMLWLWRGYPITKL